MQFDVFPQLIEVLPIWTSNERINEGVQLFVRVERDVDDIIEQAVKQIAFWACARKPPVSKFPAPNEDESRITRCQQAFE